MSENPTPPAAETAEAPVNRADVLRNLTVLAALIVASVLWWEVFRKPVLFVVTLGILVAIHEWGHFIAAKAVGVRVYEFALGFGPKLVTYMRRGGTDYTVRAFPLGGFVNPKGMQPDDPIEPDGLNGRRPAERALVYLAGPLMNVILGAALLMTVGWVAGTPDTKVALVGEVTKGREAARMQVVTVNGQPVTGAKPGLRVGDRILSIDGRPVTLENVTRHINPNADKEITVAVRRGKDTLELRGTPRRAQSPAEQFVTVGAVAADNPLGLRPGDQLWTVDDLTVFALESRLAEAQALLKQKAGQPVTLSVWRNGDTVVELRGPAQEIPLSIAPGTRFEGQLGFRPLAGQGPRQPFLQSAGDGIQMLGAFVEQIGRLFSSPKQLGGSVGGPIAIFDQLGNLDRLPLLYYFMIAASLSLSLAIFNLLPVPLLDGGHMLMVTVEVIRRRRLEPDTQRAVALLGLALIGVLFIYITYKDLVERIL